MAKGCGACGKVHAISMLECIQGSLPAPTVERMPQPELSAPEGRLTPDTGSLTVPEGRLTGSLTPDPGSLTVPDVTPKGSLTGSLTKQQRYRQTHPDWYRTYQREYMKRRRKR